MLEIIRFSVCVMLLNIPHYLLCSVPFFEDLRVKPRTVISMIVLTGIVTSVANVLLVSFVPNWERFNTPFLLTCYLIYVLQYMRYFKISIFKLISVFFIVQAYSTMLNMTGKFIHVRLYPEPAAVRAATSYTLIVLGLMAVTYPMLFLFFKNRFTKVFRQYSDKGFWRLCITPLLFFVINLILTAMIQGRSFSNADLFVLYLIIMLTGLITYYLTLRAGVDMAESSEARSEMEKRLALQAQHYLQLTERVEHTRAARHDLRHHLSVILAYVERADRDGLAKYLEDYLGHMPEDAIAPLCGNYAVDAVAQHYLQMAREAGAELSIRFQIPNNAGIIDSDLCIVFGNILENAAESVANQTEGPRFITARCEAKNGRIVLTVDNSGGEPTGGKAAEPFKGLGIGLRSVRAVADRHGGSLTFERVGDVYKTSVMLMSKTE